MWPFNTYLSLSYRRWSRERFGSNGLGLGRTSRRFGSGSFVGSNRWIDNSTEALDAGYFAQSHCCVNIDYWSDILAERTEQLSPSSRARQHYATLCLPLLQKAAHCKHGGKISAHILTWHLHMRMREQAVFARPVYTSTARHKPWRSLSVTTFTTRRPPLYRPQMQYVAVIGTADRVLLAEYQLDRHLYYERDAAG